jgi:hypothetical protein
MDIKALPTGKAFPFQLCYAYPMDLHPQELLSALLRQRAALVARRDEIDRAITTTDARIVEARMLATRSNLPCWKCDADQAQDVRHILNSSDCEIQMTPNGLPLGCCRVRVAAAFMAANPGQPARGRM